MATERADRPDILIPKPELYPPRELVITHSLRAIQAATISADNNIYILVGPLPEPKDLPPEIKFKREEIMDNGATAAFIAELEKSPFKFKIIDTEGAKEKQAGKAGVAMDLAIGTYGSGDKMVTGVADVIEGTKSATHGRPNALSIMAIAPVDGITLIPEENGEKINYLQKLFAPGEFDDLISIDRPTKNNLQMVAKVAQIPSGAITVAVMDRPANKTIIESAKQFGANVEIISAGDFVWCLKAIDSDPKSPIIVLGRGGAEEGSIAAVAARAVDATCQLRYISHADKEKDLELENQGIIWNIDEFVSARPEHCMVFAPAITKSTHFGLLPVRRKPSSRIIDTLVVDINGFNIRTDKVAT